MIRDMLREERSPWSEVTLYSICPPSSASYRGFSSLVIFHTWLVFSALLMSNLHQKNSISFSIYISKSP